MDYEFSAGSFGRIGKFVDVRRISRLDGGDASGGFGTTYIALDPKLARRVVIKEFFPGDIATRHANGSIGPVAGADKLFSELRQKFVTEARTLADCGFANVVIIYELFEFGSDSNAFMVMEFVRDDTLHPDAMHQADPIYHELLNAPDRAAPTLEELVHYQKPDFTKFAATFYRLLDAVQNVHSQGIVHRDIKPANVMMPMRRVDGHDDKYERRPVLIDFGASRKASLGIKRSTSLIYTPGYAPPEQMNILGDEGPWTDIFALAATAYYALSGRHPDDQMLGSGKSPGAAFQAAVGGTCPVEFAAAMEWALQLDPSKRPQSVRQWRQKLPDYGLARAETGWNRRQLLLAGSVVGGVVVAGGLGMFAFRQGVPATVETSVRRPVAGPAVPVGFASAAAGGEAAISASGAAFATNERFAGGQRMVAGIVDSGTGVRALYRSMLVPSLGQCVLQLDDGGLIVGGCSDDPPYKALVVRVRPDGTEMWSRSPDAGAINRIALLDGRIHVVCGSPDAQDSASRAKLHVFGLDGSEQGSGFDLSVRPHESISRVAMLDAERIVTVSQRSRPNGMMAGVLAGYKIGNGETTDLWPAYSDEKWLNENNYKACQPYDFAVINGDAFVVGSLISQTGDKVNYSPYLLRLDCEHGTLRWAKARPFGDEQFAFPIRTIALAVVEDGARKWLYAAYCPPDADGNYRQSRIVQIGPDGDALASVTLGSADKPFAVQSLAGDANGAIALGYSMDGSVLIRRLTWDT